MARRSLQASTTGIEKAKRAFRRTQWTQEDLACEVGIETRQPIWKFFAGKPIERQTFLEICFRLGLDWQEIAALPTDSVSPIKEDEQDELSLDALVQSARSRRFARIQTQCGIVRLLDTPRPIELEDIYVNIDLFENLTSQRWIEKPQLHCFDVEGLNYRSRDRIYQERIPAMEAVTAYSKLTILGKPGSGKTTLLQYIAIKCNRSELLPELLPIFIRLKSFAENASETRNFSLFSYINQELSKSDLSEQQVETLLSHGKALILLDGLDEVQEHHRAEVQQQIRTLSENYDKNRFMVSCRTSTSWCWLEQFTDVETVDLNSSQIEAFAQKWFINVGKNSRQQGLLKAVQFLQKLQLSENRQICKLARTPLFLHLTCSVFQVNSDFSAQRTELYKQALDILLFRWDRVRGIPPDKSLYQLSLPDKIKLLSHIAVVTFEQGEYFFTQSNLLHYIKDYLRILPTIPDDAEEINFISEAVLSSLLVEHGIIVEQAQGIYSFLYPTFQEYLTARNIVASFKPEILRKNLKQLAIHMSEPRWCEVFLLTAEMLENADTLVQLMQQHSDELIATDEKLQHFLVWLHQKSLSVEAAPYKPAAIRAFYLTLDLHDELELARDLSLTLTIDAKLASNLTGDLSLDLSLKRLLSVALTISDNPSVEQILALNFAFPENLDPSCHAKLQHSLQELREQLPILERNPEKLKAWWRNNGQTWIEKLKFQILCDRNIGHQWQFGEQQKVLLQQYYNAKYLLIDCLNNSFEVSSTVREKVEETLLLPALLKA